jgi:hypothetical protein
MGGGRNQHRLNDLPGFELVEEFATTPYKQLVQQTRRAVSIGGWNQKPGARMAIAFLALRRGFEFFLPWHSRCLDQVIPVRDNRYRCAYSEEGE